MKIVNSVQTNVNSNYILINQPIELDILVYIYKTIAAS